MKAAYVLVGLPGCGKSSVLEPMRKAGIIPDDAFIYSTDTWIEEQARMSSTSYDLIVEDLIGEATLQCNADLDQALADGRVIVWDQTNLTVSKRAYILQVLQGYQVHAIYLEPPVSINDIGEWTRRLSSRPGKTIPEVTLQQMWKDLEQPTLAEGFATVRALRTFR